MAHYCGGPRLPCAQAEGDAVSGRARDQSVQGDGTGISGADQSDLGDLSRDEGGYLLEAEAIMLKDRQTVILAAERAEGSETKGRGWGQLCE